MTTTLLSLADAKLHLGIPSSDTTDDAELQTFIDAAAKLVEQRVGPVDAATVTETVYGDGSSTLLLRHTRVLTVTTVNGVAPADQSLILDGSAGVLMYQSGAFPSGRFTITYTVGMSPVPANLTLATKIIVAHMWETQRGSASLPMQDTDEQGYAATGAGFTIPFRAEALIAPHEQLLGFA